MKIKILSVLLMISSVLITGCGGGGDDHDGNGEIFDETKTWEVYEKTHLVDIPVEINFWSANSAVDIQGKAISELVDEFNAYQKKTYPTSFIKVTAAFQGGYAVQNTKLQAAISGANNPEIAQVGVSSLPLYTDSVIDQRTIFTYDDLRDVNPGFLQYAMHKDKFVGYPYFASTNVLVTNRTLLEKTGKKIPTVEEIVADPENSIWTWDYMKEVSIAATDTKDSDPNNHVYGYSATGPGLYEMMYTQGVAIYNETATKINFDNKAGLEGLKFWQSMVVDGAMLNPVLDPNHGTKIQGSFALGNAGMLNATSAVILTLYQNVIANRVEQGLDPLFELDVLPYPKKTNFYSNQSGGSIVVFNNKSVAKTKAAVEFLRWLQAPEQSAKFSLSTGYLPTTNAARETDLWKNDETITPLLERVANLMQFTPPGDLKLPVGRAKALADDDFGKYVKGIWLDDCTRKPEDVLDDCAARISFVLEANS